MLGLRGFGILATGEGERGDEQQGEKGVGVSVPGALLMFHSE
jgi:hypothetical protein